MWHLPRPIWVNHQQLALFDGIAMCIMKWPIPSSLTTWRPFSNANSSTFTDVQMPKLVEKPLIHLPKWSLRIPLHQRGPGCFWGPIQVQLHPTMWRRFPFNKDFFTDFLVNIGTKRISSPEGIANFVELGKDELPWPVGLKISILKASMVMPLPEPPKSYCKS